MDYSQACLDDAELQEHVRTLSNFSLNEDSSDNDRLWWKVQSIMDQVWVYLFCMCFKSVCSEMGRSFSEYVHGNEHRTHTMLPTPDDRVVNEAILQTKMGIGRLYGAHEAQFQATFGELEAESSKMNLPIWDHLSNSFDITKTDVNLQWTSSLLLRFLNTMVDMEKLTKDVVRGVLYVSGCIVALEEATSIRPGTEWVLTEPFVDDVGFPSPWYGKWVDKIMSANFLSDDNCVITIDFDEKTRDFLLRKNEELTPEQGWQEHVRVFAQEFRQKFLDADRIGREMYMDTILHMVNERVSAVNSYLHFFEEKIKGRIKEGDDFFEHKTEGSVLDFNGKLFIAPFVKGRSKNKALSALFLQKNPDIGDCDDLPRIEVHKTTKEGRKKSKKSKGRPKTVFDFDHPLTCDLWWWCVMTRLFAKEYLKEYKNFCAGPGGKGLIGRLYTHGTLSVSQLFPYHDDDDINDECPSSSLCPATCLEEEEEEDMYDPTTPFGEDAPLSQTDHSDVHQTKKQRTDDVFSLPIN